MKEPGHQMVTGLRPTFGQGFTSSCWMERSFSLDVDPNPRTVVTVEDLTWGAATP